MSAGQRLQMPHATDRAADVVAVLMVSFNQVIQLYGLRYITAGLAAVLSSALTPISLLGFAVIVGQERFVRRQVAAIAIGVTGILVLFGPAALAGRLDMPNCWVPPALSSARCAIPLVR